MRSSARESHTRAKGFKHSWGGDRKGQEARQGRGAVWDREDSFIQCIQLQGMPANPKLWLPNTESHDALRAQDGALAFPKCFHIKYFNRYKYFYIKMLNYSLKLIFWKTLIELYWYNAENCTATIQPCFMDLTFGNVYS